MFHSKLLLTSLTVNVDDPNVFANAPISIQVIGRTLEEEAVIAMSERVDAAVKKFKAETK